MNKIQELISSIKRFDEKSIKFIKKSPGKILQANINKKQVGDILDHFLGMNYKVIGGDIDLAFFQDENSFTIMKAIEDESENFDDSEIEIVLALDERSKDFISIVYDIDKDQWSAAAKGLLIKEIEKLNL